MGGEFGGEWIYVCGWLSPFAVHLKLSQHCLLIGYTSVQNGASQVVLVVKNLPANVGDTRDMGLIPGSGRCPGVGNGSPLQQYSCLENPLGQRSLAGYSPLGWRRVGHE